MKANNKRTFHKLGAPSTKPVREGGATIDESNEAEKENRRLGNVQTERKAEGVKNQDMSKKRVVG